MKYINITDWKSHQHYKDRRPTWIKLEIEIIDEFDKDGDVKKFFDLSDCAKLTFIGLLCLRANYNKKIPFKSEKSLKERLGFSKIELQPLVNNGYITIDTESVSKAYQVDTEKKSNLPPEREIEREGEREKEIYSIVEKLNSIANKNFKSTTDKTKQCINARFKEKFTLDDFFTVLENKKEWLSDSKMAKFYRPETLFGTKFESYLNEIKIDEGKNEFNRIYNAISKSQ